MSTTHRISIRSAANTSIISGADPTVVSPSDPLRLFIIQASIIIVLARLLAYPLGKIKQPSVIAEVIGGILLGPTVLGRIPNFTHHIFPPASIPYLNLVANLGLVLFLFIVGLEVDLRIIRKCAIPSLAVSISGLVIPLGLGMAVSVGIYNDLIDKSKVSFGHFALFTGVAMGITALPVLARIVLDLKLIHTRVGVVVLAAGVGNDVVGWILLALAIALVNASSGLTALYIFLVVLGWVAVLFFAIKPVYMILVRRTGSLMNGPTGMVMTLTILLVFASAFLTDCIGVHAIFGAFLVGLIIPHEGGFAVKLTEKLEDLISTLFLPLYFALSGLSTNLATLDSGRVWGYVIAICCIAFFSKFLACGGAARLTGFTNRESAAIGTLMSCKGLVELIVLNIGLSAGILSTQVFSMFVLMAIVSTCATTPLTLLVYPKRYRKKFEDGSEEYADDDEGDVSGATASSKSRRGDAGASMSGQRYLFVLDRFDHLPGILTLIQLLKPSYKLPLQQGRDIVGQSAPTTILRKTRDEAPSQASSRSHDHKSETEADLSRGESEEEETSASGRMQIHGLRLVEMDSRTSAVMRVAESDETLRADSLINVFSTFVRLNQLPVRSSMHVVPNDEFCPTVVERARHTSANFVVLPWTLPAAGLLGSSSDGSATYQNIFARPVETFFGTSGDRSEASSHYKAAFVRKVVQTSPCDVGLLLERPGALGTSATTTWGKHIIFAFSGGPDDRCALEMLLRWCRAGEDVYVTVYRFAIMESDGEHPQNEADTSVIRSLTGTRHHGDTVHRTQAASALYGSAQAVQDTMYPAGNLDPLQAQLQDDISIEALERERANDEYLAAHYRIKTVGTPTPLKELINIVQSYSGLGQGSVEEDDSHLPAPSLVVVGRNRRMPTYSHRQELRQLVAQSRRIASAQSSAGPDAVSAESRLIDGEMCKIIGEAGMAVCGLARCSLPTLVVASSLYQRAAGEEEA